MAYTVLPKLIYSHLHAVTDNMEFFFVFVFETSGNNYADPGSLLTGLQSEIQYVPPKNKEGISSLYVQHFSFRSRDSVVGTAIGL